MFANENTMQHMSMTTYFRGMPSPETLTQIASKYRRVIIFVDFNNISRGFYKPEIIADIVTYMVNNSSIPGYVLKDWITFQLYFEAWAMLQRKQLNVVYFCESGESYYHKNLLSSYKANRITSRFVLADGLMMQFDNNIDKVEEVFRAFKFRLWKWIEAIASMSHIPMFRFENLDADFIPEYLLRRTKLYDDDTCYVILSNDGDMIQTIDVADNVFVVDGEIVITETNWYVSKKYLAEGSTGLIEPGTTVPGDRIILYKAVAGDTADSIPGVKGMGKKTVFKDLLPLIPANVRCDDLLAMKQIMTQNAANNKAAAKVLANWDSFALGVKLVSFNHMIEHLKSVPTRVSEFRNLIERSGVEALTEGSTVMSMMRSGEVALT